MPGVVVAGLVAAEIVVAGSFIAFAINVAVTLALVAVSYALRPDAPDTGVAGAGDRSKDRLRNSRQPLAAHRVVYGQVRVGGAITYLNSTDDDEQLHQLLTIASHPLQEVVSLYAEDKLISLDSNNKVITEKWKNQMYVYSGLGTTASDSNLLSEMVTNTNGNWTTSHKQEGRSKLYCRFLYDRDAFGSSVPNVTALVKGKLLYDPRDSSTSYSTNSALCILDYIRDTGYGLGEPDSNIDTASFITAANICDESVTLAGGGAENRYSVNGTFETNEKPERILKDLLSTCSGTLTYQGGKWALRVGAFVTPTIEINEDDVQGQIDVTSQVGRRNLFNQVQSVYTSPQDLYQPTDAPIVKNAMYLAEDQGEVITRDIEFPFTTAASTAQRLSKIELEKIRQQISVTMTLSLKKGLQVQTGDTIGVTNSRMGWSNKPFVIQEWGIQFDSDKEALVIGVSLRETASDVFDWNTGNETTVDASPNTTLPDPFVVRQPTGLSVSEEIYFNSAGATGSGAKVRAVVSWASAGKFIHEYELQYKLSSSSIWLFATTAKDSPAAVNDLTAASYDFRVRGATSIGSRSLFTTTTKQLAGLTARPADVTGFSVRAIDGSAHLSWDAISDLDVVHGGYLRIRHSKLLTGAAWGNGADISKRLDGGSTDVVLPLLTGTYLIKAIDSSDNFSLDPDTSVTTVKNVNKFNFVQDIDEQPSFSGIKTDMVVVNSILKLAGAAQFIDLEDGSQLLLEDGSLLERELDSTTAVALSGSYDFNNVLDLGGVFTSRVSSVLTSVSSEIAGTIDEITDLMDDWVSFDPAPSDEAVAGLFISETNDNPNVGSPSWTPYEKLVTGDYKARAFRFRLEAETTLSAYNIEITELTVTVDMPDRVERKAGITSGSSTYSVVYAQAYKAIPTVGITPNNMGSNNHFVVSNSSATGFDIDFYQGNGTGSPLSVDFNYQSIGY